MPLPTAIAAACRPVLDALKLGGVDVVDVLSMCATDVRVVVEAAGMQFVMRLMPRSHSAGTPRRPTPRRARSRPRLRVHHTRPSRPRPDWREQLLRAAERLNLKDPR